MMGAEGMMGKMELTVKMEMMDLVQEQIVLVLMFRCCGDHHGCVRDNT